MLVPHRIAGIPCLIGVTYFHQQPANRHADNPDDYYGYEEYAFEILDRRGRRADWLVRKLDDREEAAVYAAINAFIEKEARYV